MKTICGIDEAGRGCCAGDLVVAGTIFYADTEIEGLNDSKKITEKRRYKLAQKIELCTQSHIVTISPHEIDEQGISKCMQNALREIKNVLIADEYIFDGNTTFGVEGITTLIQADGKVPQVSAASILAKVTHDSNIIQDAKKYPQYGFEKHKGYATKQHIEMIKLHGYSPIHRKSYKIKALQKTLFDIPVS